MEEDKKKNQLNINLSQEMAQGTYSNLALITHSTSEFIVDFIRVMPGVPTADVKSRVILTPEHAKRLLMALDDNVRKYEAQFGAIKLPNHGSPIGGGMPPMNFGGTAGEA